MFGKGGIVVTMVIIHFAFYSKRQVFFQRMFLGAKAMRQRCSASTLSTVRKCNPMKIFGQGAKRWPFPHCRIGKK